MIELGKKDGIIITISQHGFSVDKKVGKKEL